MVLTGCTPERVFYYFEKLSQIPHGSGNMDAISKFCADFAEAHGLRYRRDAYDNVIIFKPASPGREQDPTVILQGHLDMVCEKVPGSTFDFEKDSLKLLVEDDWVTADGTTLGADNGIAIAMALAILESDSLSHPALEAVFTTDEETSLVGATAMDVSDLQGRYLLNLDSEDEGVLTVSCAGGVRVVGTLPVERQSGSWTGLRVRICGLQGGHSGVQINEGRGCAMQLMGRALYRVSKSVLVLIQELGGGSKDNVISSDCTAVLALAAEDLDTAKTVLGKLEQELKQEFAVTDPGVAIEVAVLDAAAMTPLTAESTKRAIGLLANYPQGVMVMSADLPGLVQTSLNMGVLCLEDAALKACFALRSSCASQKQMLIERLESFFELLDGSAEAQGDYPGWEYRRDSKLRDHMCATWEALSGTPAKVEAIHAGLECGLFAGKIPDLDAVSLGPTMRDVHSVNERLSISSTKRTFDLVCKALETWH